MSTSTVAVPVRLGTRDRIEAELDRLRREHRERLDESSGSPARHYHRPAERAFTAPERDDVTILIGGLTAKHDYLLRAVFGGAGYRVERVPEPDTAAFQLGKELGNNGQCNPTYFTVGALVGYLKALEAEGLTRQEIIDRYVYFTAGCCGPCRFGMYEAEYRLALDNAGFGGFRVLLFQMEDGVHATTAGLRYSVAFGMGALNTLNYGDVLNDLTHRIQPFEVREGATKQAAADAMEILSATIESAKEFDLDARWPAWLTSRIAGHPKLQTIGRRAGTIWDFLYGPAMMAALEAARARFDEVEVDRLRVKPKVKITGEFWAQTTEGDGNFRMFEFLEREGAQVVVEPIGNWVTYLLWQAAERARRRRGLDQEPRRASDVRGRLADALKFHAKMWGFWCGERFYAHQYRRVVDKLGGIAGHLLDNRELARLAAPFYDPMVRGGEGHLEVAKNIYYTVNRKAHMVLSLKPFGCMPSTQSDGVQSAVMGRFKDMIFLPIETSGEGAVNAHSRVQMTLGEAKVKAKREFEDALGSTGKRLDDIRAYVAERPALRRPCYRVPHRKGIAGEAANFVLHVSDLMDREWVAPGLGEPLGGRAS